ncbi:DUF4097 family beta strand repeat-containing protein [Actinacidiphila soli]|uniref:DUF4097 family beta strand repeat-containing protein n=1 Tax=Actinacidiphila soli TaxID=2487275 RepID=UPI000FCCCB55|nr:DUF4097 family beta strand repeat-containing protein [Actinacidiphila soli]
MSTNTFRRLLLASSGAVLALGTVAGCADVSDDAKPDKRDFAISGKQLTIDASDSKVVVKPADVKDVKVTRWFDAWAVGGSTRTTWSMEDGHTLKLRVTCRGMVTNCASRHEVLVPRGVAVTVANGDGKVEASGFDTALKVSTKDGSVVIRDISGPLDISTGDGKVEATGVTSRRVTAHSSDGAVRLRFTTVPDQVLATTSDGKVTVELPDERYDVSTTTGDGQVTVAVPRDSSSAHQVTVHTNDGSVTVRGL